MVLPGLFSWDTRPSPGVFWIFPRWGRFSLSNIYARGRHDVLNAPRGYWSKWVEYLFLSAVWTGSGTFSPSGSLSFDFAWPVFKKGVLVGLVMMENPFHFCVVFHFSLRPSHFLPGLLALHGRHGAADRESRGQYLIFVSLFFFLQGHAFCCLGESSSPEF